MFAAQESSMDDEEREKRKKDKSTTIYEIIKDLKRQSGKRILKYNQLFFVLFSFCCCWLMRMTDLIVLIEWMNRRLDVLRKVVAKGLSEHDLNQCLKEYQAIDIIQADDQNIVVVEHWSISTFYLFLFILIFFF